MSTGKAGATSATPRGIKLIFFIGLFFPLLLFAQKKTEYTASNGITYHVGDTLKLGRGSDPQGNFRYVVIGGWASWLPRNSSKGAEQDNMGRAFTGTAAVIRKMRTETRKKVDRQVFVVGMSAISNCDIYIEDALATGEVVGGKKTETVAVAAPVASSADELAKYKKLLDQGAITKPEYEAIKKKLLKL